MHIHVETLVSLGLSMCRNRLVHAKGHVSNVPDVLPVQLLWLSDVGWAEEASVYAIAAFHYSLFPI